MDQQRKTPIYIIDLIGQWCGMHYYLQAFARLFPEAEYSSTILSNFEISGNKAFMPIIFGHNKLVGMCQMLWAWLRYVAMVIVHREARFIYLSYGEPRDVLFMLPAIISRRVCIDIHEVHALRYADTSLMANILTWFTRQLKGSILYHSDRTLSILTRHPLRCKLLYLPHLSYCFPCTYNLEKVSDEVLACFTSSNRHKYLYFGNISTPKGFDVVQDVFGHQLTAEELEQVELVVAGKNVENFQFDDLKKASNFYHIIARHINDDEMAYLYSHTDFVLQPYRKSSQSGIMAMACHFRKPVLMSDIPYFSSMISRFPSFGHIAPLEDYARLLRLTLTSTENSYFSAVEVDRYEHKEEIDTFLRQYR